ncbi:MAG: serine/threonine-protein kinase, partial [Planctomyces sp.]
ILTIGIQIADGLEAAHRSNIIHRDIKPANILLEGGILGIRITDFGLARTMGESNLTQSGIVAGTPSYMSPEQARGIPLDHRSDLFSFGSVLYALATGQPPFSAETPLGVLRKITEEEPRTVQEIRADLPDWFSALIHRLLRKNAEDRYSTAGEVSALLNQCLQHILPGNNVPVPRELLSEYRVCSARRIIVFGTAAVAVLVVVAMLIRQRQPAPVIPSQTAEETRDTATASERTVPRKYPVQSLEVNGLNKPEVKYAFPENQTVSYLFECSGRKELLKEQINGLITLVRSVGQSDESSIPLQVRCRIERNRSEQTSGSTPSGPAFTSTSSLSLTSSDDRILSLLITSEGAVLRRDRESQLPLGLGDAVKLVIHDFSSASIGSHQNKRVVMHDSSSNQYPSPTGPGQAGILSTHPGADLPPQSGLSPPFARFHDQRAFVIPVFQFEQSSVQNSLELAVTTQQQPSNDSRIRIREQFLSPQTGNVRIAGTAVRTFDEESGVLDFTEIHQTILEGIDENGKPDSQWKVDLDCRRITEQESEEWEQKRRLPDDVPASDVEKENPFRIAE